MKKAEGISEYIIVKADTDSEWDYCDYAIVKISQAWIDKAQARLRLLEQFKTDKHFVHISFLEQPAGFFKTADDEKDGDTSIDEIFGKYDDWAFIILDENELDKLTNPQSKLDVAQVIISWDATLKYKAYGKNSGDEYYTHDVVIAEILNAMDNTIVLPI